MKSSSASKPPLEAHPHLGHIFLVSELRKRSEKGWPRAAREEAAAEIDRYRDEGIIIGQFKEDNMARRKAAQQDPPEGAQTFRGKGIIFAVIDDREEMGEGKVTTVDVIADAIEAALDSGYETSEEIARYLTTSAFQHQPDKRVRFNSVLKAGDVVGAQILRKLYNAYNELAQLAADEEDAQTKKDIKAEALGFAEALQVVLSPFTCEHPQDPRLVDWDQVDRLTAAFEKEQRLVRQARGGKPQ